MGWHKRVDAESPGRPLLDEPGVPAQPVQHLAGVAPAAEGGREVGSDRPAEAGRGEQVPVRDGQDSQHLVHEEVGHGLGRGATSPRKALGSAPPRRAAVASRTPAGQPPVQACSSRDWDWSRCRFDRRSISSVSSAEKRNVSARISLSCPVDRSAPSDRGVSQRLQRMRRTPAGGAASSVSRPASAAGAVISWTSCRTSVTSPARCRARPPDLGHEHRDQWQGPAPTELMQRAVRWHRGAGPERGQYSLPEPPRIIIA